MHQLFKKIQISGELICLTGLHIGDSKESIEIGGVDSPVIRRKDNNQPYIPGSSLKGKIRCLLEQATGINKDSKCKNDGTLISELFGATENKEKDKEKDSIPSRIIVRDADMCNAIVFKDSDYTDGLYTEIKFENSIDRFKGTAAHPRQIERVPAGAKFSVYFIFNIFAEDEKSAEDKKEKYLDLFRQGIKLLEYDYLGGSGSRGYGQIKFNLLPEEIVFNNEDLLTLVEVTNETDSQEEDLPESLEDSPKSE